MEDRAEHVGLPRTMEEAGRSHGPGGWVLEVLRFVRRKPLGALGGAVLLLLPLVALLAPLIAPHDPVALNVPNRLKPPGPEFWLGTDTLGRDSFSRIIFGARVSLYVGLVSVSLGSVVGIVLGVTSGYLGGRFDLLVQRAVDAAMGFPPLVLALILVVGLGPSLHSVTIAIGINLIPRVTRVSRSSTLAIKAEQYVLAANAIGCSALRVMTQHVVPNSLAPVFVLATGYLGTAIVAEASLSFLGLGVPPPQPTWGGMLEMAAKGYLEAAPWLAIYPGGALAVVAFAFALLGDALRDVLDPRLRTA